MPRLRMSTVLKSGRRSGQPPRARIPLDSRARPKPLKDADRSRHSCGECFGPRNRYSGSFFCEKCVIRLFGSGGLADYQSFLRREKLGLTRARKRKGVPASWPA